MPIYEYHCRACGHEFEVIQKITDRPIRKCEECGRLQAKRGISQTSFVLKGSGWYATEYGNHKSDAAKEAAEKPTKEAAEKPAKETKSQSDSSKKDADKKVVSETKKAS